MTQKEQIARDLLDIGAVFLRPDQPFTWASGIKSPIYCDNRLTLTAPAVRTRIEEGLVALIREHYPDVEVLMGTSTAGIAHAAICGHLMGLPMGYVRSSNKDHGRQNRIEGKLEAGQKVVVVEDLISTGGSCLEVVEALREAGAKVLGIVSIFVKKLRKGLEYSGAFWGGVGIVVAIIDIVIGMVYGLVSGFFGGMVDSVMQRFAEILNGIPTLVIVTLLGMVLPAGISRNFPHFLQMTLTESPVTDTSYSPAVSHAQCILPSSARSCITKRTMSSI